MKQSWLKNTVSIVGLTIYLIIAVGSIDESSIEKEVSTQPAAYSISAQELYTAYKINEVAADQIYKGKILEVYGEINNIGRDITDTIYITLKGDKYFGEVQCFFSKKHEDEIALLSKGQFVRVKCKCDGKMVNVILRGCIIEKVYYPK